MSSARKDKSSTGILTVLASHWEITCILVTCCLLGCGGTTTRELTIIEPPEPAWADQVARVRAGQSQPIHLSSIPVTNEQVRDVAGLERLETLILDAGSITDEGMDAIGDCPALIHLRVRHSDLTDSGVERLASGKCVGLRILNLPQAKLTAVGIRHLAKLPKLQQLRVGGKQLDDAAVAEIANLPALESLHLIGPSLSDKALESIAAAPQLGSFYLDECPLSDAAWRKLFTAKPNMHVHIDQHHHDRDPNRH